VLRTILVPHDGSERAEQALACAVAIGRVAGARLLLVRAYAPVNRAVLSGADSLLAAETRELSDLAQVADELSARADGLQSDGVLAADRIGVGSPAGVIVDAASVTDADLM
jgi:nucleotide-binding universal stress UspA family protein